MNGLSLTLTLWNQTIWEENMKKMVTEHIPIQEWRKKLGMQPENIVEKTLENTTQHYMRLECESRDDPRRHIRSRAPGLRCLRQKETVATDSLFPSITSDRGNTYLQFSVE